MNYWLIKSEPDCYSIDDLKRDKKASWSGVRNYQARNFLKNMKVGDLAIFYHSSANPPSAVGIAKVVKNAYPDKTAWTKKPASTRGDSSTRGGDDHYDPKSTKENPIWYAVDFGFVSKFKEPLTLSQIKINPKLEGMMVTQTGSRLSVQPVSKEHFETIQKLEK